MVQLIQVSSLETLSIFQNVNWSSSKSTDARIFQWGSKTSFASTHLGHMNRYFLKTLVWGEGELWFESALNYQPAHILEASA